MAAEVVCNVPLAGYQELMDGIDAENSRRINSNPAMPSIFSESGALFRHLRKAMSADHHEWSWGHSPFMRTALVYAFLMDGRLLLENVSERPCPQENARYVTDEIALARQSIAWRTGVAPVLGHLEHWLADADLWLFVLSSSARLCLNLRPGCPGDTFRVLAGPALYAPATFKIIVDGFDDTLLLPIQSSPSQQPQHQHQHRPPKSRSTTIVQRPSLPPPRLSSSSSTTSLPGPAPLPLTSAVTDGGKRQTKRSKKTSGVDLLVHLLNKNKKRKKTQ